MSHSDTQTMATASDTHDHILRPRPRKPQHSQLSELVREHSNGPASAGGTVTPPVDGLASGMTR
jgi:sterol O-acyltransferase